MDDFFFKFEEILVNYREIILHKGINDSLGLRF